MQSLDTNGSILGGIILELESVSLENSENASATASAYQHSEARAALNVSAKDAKVTAQSSTADDGQSTPKASPFWYQFPGFEPDPRAPFKHELGRLYKHVSAKTKKERKDLQTQALTAEIKFHYGASMSRLDRWQELCEEVGIEKIPTSITQCQKVSMSARLRCACANMPKVLKPVFVNLFNLVDHRRNPDLKIVRFKSYGEFNNFTRKGHEFPRDCAKQEGFIKVLLKKM